MLIVIRVDQLKCLVLTVRLQVCLLIGHLVEVVNWNHLEDLDIGRVLESSVRAARVHKLTAFRLVSLKFDLEGKFVVLLHVVDIARVGQHRLHDVRLRRGQPQVVIDVLFLLGHLLGDVDAKLAVRQRPLHILDLPVALEGVDKVWCVLGLYPQGFSSVPTVEFHLEKVAVTLEHLDLFDLLVANLGEAILSVVRQSERIIDEEDGRLAEDHELLHEFELDQGHEVGGLVDELAQRFHDGVRYLGSHQERVGAM